MLGHSVVSDRGQEHRTPLFGIVHRFGNCAGFLGQTVEVPNSTLEVRGFESHNGNPVQHSLRPTNRWITLTFEKPRYPAGSTRASKAACSKIRGPKLSSRIEAQDFLSSLDLCRFPVRSSLGAWLRVVFG